MLHRVALFLRYRQSLDIGVGSGVQLGAIWNLKIKSWFNSDLLDPLPASSFISSSGKTELKWSSILAFQPVPRPSFASPSSLTFCLRCSIDPVLVVKMTKSSGPFLGLFLLVFFSVLANSDYSQIVFFSDFLEIFPFFL